MQLDVDGALGGATEAGEREADDMRALFEEEEPSQKRSGLGLFTLLIVLGVGAIFVAGFVSPDIGKQLDRALKLAGVEESILRVGIVDSPSLMQPMTPLCNKRRKLNSQRCRSCQR